LVERHIQEGGNHRCNRVDSDSSRRPLDGQWLSQILHSGSCCSTV